MTDVELDGIYAVKFPVAELSRSRAWYERVFGFAVELEFPDDDGVVRGVAGKLPGVPDAYVALREDPSRAEALAGANLCNFAVRDRAAIDSWGEHLDALGVSHSPVMEATIGWIMVLHDPDGLEIHLYSRARHGVDVSGRTGYGRTERSVGP